MSNLPTATDSPAEAVTREDGVPVFDPTALADLGSRLSPGSLTTDPDVVDAHSSDEALFCPREGAIALVRAVSAEDVQEVMRFATEHRVPVVPQGARSGISGGANAVPGEILLNVSKMKDIVAVNEAERLVTVQPRDHQPGSQGPPGPVRSVLPTGPWLGGAVVDRRQHRHQCGRAVLREIRCDQGLRPIVEGRPRRRDADHPGTRDREGCGRARHASPLHRLRGHAGHRRRGDPAPHPGTARSVHRDRDLPRRAQRTPDRGRLHGGRRRAEHARIPRRIIAAHAQRLRRLRPRRRGRIDAHHAGRSVPDGIGGGDGDLRRGGSPLRCPRRRVLRRSDRFRGAHHCPADDPTGV
jgi:hypothetical protein